MHPLPIQRLVFWWNRSFPKCVNCSGCSSESTTTTINNNYNHSKTKPPSSKISTTVTTTTRKETAVTTRRNPQNNSNNNIRKLTMTIISHSIVVAVHFFLASKSVSQQSSKTKFLTHRMDMTINLWLICAFFSICPMVQYYQY